MLVVAVIETSPRPCGPGPSLGEADDTTEAKKRYLAFRERYSQILALHQSGVPWTERMADDLYDLFLAWIEVEDSDEVFKLLRG